MSIINKGTSFANGEQLTADKINDLLDLATFNQDATDSQTTDVNSAGQIVVNQGGIDTAQLATDAVETAKIKDANVTFAKLTDVIDDDTMATATDTTLATSDSIKAYADSLRPKFFSLTGGTNTLASGNQTSGTITWNIADYTSSDAGFDTSKITAVVIYSLVSSSTENTAVIEASLPNGQLTTIARIKDGGTNSNSGTSATTYNLPINKDQVSFSIAYSAINSTAETTIRGVILN
jgi:hypothetical protein